MFDEEDWNNEDDGVFNDPEASFGQESSAVTISREDDAKMHSPPANTKALVKQQPRQPVALVAAFGPDGQPKVARTVMQDGKPVHLEEFRRPTPDEYNAIMFGGKIVRGGVAAENVPTSANLQASMQRTPLGEMSTQKKVLLGLGAVAVLGGVGYGVYRWKFAKKGK